MSLFKYFVYFCVVEQDARMRNEVVGVKKESLHFGRYHIMFRPFRVCSPCKLVAAFLRLHDYTTHAIDPRNKEINFN